MGETESEIIRIKSSLAGLCGMMLLFFITSPEAFWSFLGLEFSLLGVMP